MRKSYAWHDGRNGTEGTFPGAERVTVDMAGNDFLLELVFRTRPGLRGGGLAGKRGRRGYELEVADDGTARLTLDFGGGRCYRSSAVAVNDGAWHHVVAEVVRGEARGIRLYVDGVSRDGAWSGRMDPAQSLSNRADFLVGRTAGAGEDKTPRHFVGDLDFLRVARGTVQ